MYDEGKASERRQRIRIRDVDVTERTFTVTLFMALHAESGNDDPDFDSVTTAADARALFERDFPDTLPLIPELEHDFVANPVGSLATLIGAVGAWLLRKKRWLVPIPAIVANTLIIPLVLRYGYGVDVPLVLQMVYIAVGEILGCGVLGQLLASVLNSRDGIYKRT